MTHPHQLHARAGLWSLRTALTRLHHAQAAADRAEATNGDRGTLQAWRPGTGIRTTNDHGDTLLDAVIRHAGSTNPYRDRALRTQQTLDWLVREALADLFQPRVDLLEQLLTHLPDMRPATAAHLARWVDEEDKAVRRLLGEHDDRRLQPVIPCPACRAAGVLALRTSAPADQQVIVCTNECVCAGPGCGCRMGVEAEGAPHVWTIMEMRGQEEAPCSPTTPASDGGQPQKFLATSGTASQPPQSDPGHAAMVSQRPA